MKTQLILIAPVALGATLHAQAVETNVDYSLTPPIATQVDSPTAAGTANTTGDPNIFFEHGWYFRVAGDMDEAALTGANMTFIDPGGAGPHQYMTWTDINGRGLFAGRQDAYVYTNGPSAGTMMITLTMRNISGSPQVLNVFNYVDIDLCSLAQNQGVATPTQITVTEASCGEVVEFHGIGADLSDMGAFGATELGLSGDGLVTTLASATAFGPADFSGAFQWADRTIAPRECLSFQVYFVHNVGLTNESAFAMHGFAKNGTNALGVVGAPEINITEAPATNVTSGMASTFDVELSNAPNGAPNLLLVAFGRGTFPGIAGFDICVDLGTTISLFNIANAAGEASTTFTVPSNAALAGINLNMQYLVQDSTVPMGRGSNTCCAEVKVGSK